jgi:putative peptide zinc metalloprotease protein
MITLTTAVHELGHLLAAAHFGVRARSVGVGLLYVQPAAYTDVSNSWLVRRDARIAIALGGMLTQSVPVLVCYVAWRLTGSSLLGWYVLANAGFMAFNLLPFVRLDGYWILCFALDEFNLRSRAFAQCLRVLLGDRVRGSGWSGAPAVLAVLYGALSALFTAGMYVSAVAWVQSVVPARTSPYVPFAAWAAAAVTVATAAIRGRRRRRPAR